VKVSTELRRGDATSHHWIFVQEKVQKNIRGCEP
jgi:hypothetical protein